MAWRQQCGEQWDLEVCVCNLHEVPLFDSTLFLHFFDL